MHGREKYVFIESDPLPRKFENFKPTEKLKE